MSLSLPPANVGVLALVGLVPFLWALRDAGPKRGLALGSVFGLVYFGAVLYWILLFGEMGFTALVAASAAFAGLFGFLAPAVRLPGRPVLSAFGLAALWTVVMEWFRSAWPLGGFTWGGAGYTQAGDRLLLPLATVTGVWGVAFVVVAVNGLLVVALERGRGRAAGALGAACVAGALIVGPALIPFASADGRRLDVAAIQVDVRGARGLPGAQEDRAVTQMNVALDQRLATDPPDLAVWGEGAIDPGSWTDPGAIAQVRSAIAAVDVPTLAGAVTVGRGGNERTEAVLFDRSGRLTDRYAKVHLVPFGEYVPWRSELSWIKALEQIPVDRIPGGRIHTLSAEGVPAFGTPICYENSFPGVDRTMVREGAKFIVVITNNASYGFTAASRQHLLMSRLRAVEDGRWVVHAAVSGISAFIDPSGRVIAERGLFEAGIVRRTILTSDRRTPYVRYGDWFPAAALLLSVGLILVPRRRREPRRHPSPLPKRPRTLVLLPTYNERTTIAQIIDGLLALPEKVDMLVIDDRSPDGTAEVVRAFAAFQGGRVRLVERPGKVGLASAYLLGFKTALDEGYDLVVEMDSDLSHQPEELHGLLTAAHSADLVLGSRYVPGGSVTNWSRARVALSRAGNAYARFALGISLSDATSGFRAYRRGLLQDLLRTPIRSEGYGFQIELAMRAWNAGASVAEVPITFREREHGHSKISRRIVLEALWLVTVWGVKARFLSARRGEADPP